MYTGFWIGVTIAFAIVFALAYFGGKMISKNRSPNRRDDH